MSHLVPVHEAHQLTMNHSTLNPTAYKRGNPYCYVLPLCLDAAATLPITSKERIKDVTSVKSY
jgi:hypothetical protein